MPLKLVIDYTPINKFSFLKKYLLLHVFVLSTCFCLLAQSNVKLFVNYNSIQKGFFENNISYRKIVSDTFAVQKEIQQIMLRCNELSFLAAENELQSYPSDSFVLTVKPGKSFRWINLSKGNVSTELLNDAGIKLYQFDNAVFSPTDFSKNIKKILFFLENNGYPFASIKLDSILVDSNNISAALHLQKNILVVFDSVKITGDANISYRFLKNYTGINSGNLYNEKIFKTTDSRISELPYVSRLRVSSVYFYGNKAKPALYLSKRKASTFDGIIGFAPNSQFNNKLIITGDVNLKLQNILGSGKSLEASVKSFLNNSQELKLKFNYPYFLGTKLALDYGLQILKYDTAFVDVQHEFAMQYRFIGTDYFKVSYSQQSTTLLSIDTNSIFVSKLLPQANDIRNYFYGLGVKKTKLDYFLNPTKGFSVEADFYLGTKQIVRNSTINSLQISDGTGKYYNLYDSIKLEYIQYKASLLADFYFQIFKNFVLHSQARFAWLQSENLFTNELFRIGGLKTLKGFDEQSIFANKYGIANFELRYLLAQNSNFIFFYNKAWYANEARKINDAPFGFGAGMNFESGAGIFSIFYALGKQFNNPIEFENGKIHFGYLSYF